jgi:hypothetical protein
MPERRKVVGTTRSLLIIEEPCNPNGRSRHESETDSAAAAVEVGPADKAQPVVDGKRDPSETVVVGCW